MLFGPPAMITFLAPSLSISASTPASIVFVGVGSGSVGAGFTGGVAVQSPFPSTVTVWVSLVCVFLKYLVIY